MFVALGRFVKGRELSCASSQLNRMSRAVKGVPSCHLMLGRRRQVTFMVPSGFTIHVPSVTDGTWIVSPDGTMKVTWRLRPNIKWHDGTPFTARDIRFSWELAQDNSLPLTKRPSATNITSIDVPDDLTAVMNWKIPNTYAHIFTPSDLYIYPEHIVRPLWESGAGEAMLSNDFFHGGFVGLGPYKVDSWTVDNSIVFSAFDDFFLGRPKIDTI